MADDANRAPSGASRADLEAERAELQKEHDRIDTLLRRLDDPEERRHRDAARLIAIATVWAAGDWGVPTDIVDAIRERDPDGVGRFFEDLAFEADGWTIRPEWTIRPDRQGNGPFLWAPKTAADALAWPEVGPDDQADANKPAEPGES